MQVPKIETGVWISSVDDDAFVNTDHVPVHCYLPGNISRGTKNDGNVQIETGGAEK